MATAERLIAQDVFAFLTPKQVDAISNAAQPVSFPSGTAVYSQGEKAESLYVVLEGQVDLFLPGQHGVTMPVDHLGKGDMFGGSASFEAGAYQVSARCASDCRMLRIRIAALRHLMDEDCRIGYEIQKRISTIYFKRYVDTMQKLQAIIMTIPVEIR